MKCTDLLLQDHRVILRALDVLEEMAKHVERHQALEHDDVESILRFLRSFADDYHQGKEESALFPELRRLMKPEGPLRQMLFEHDQERSLVEAIEDALFTRRGPEFVEFARRLIGLLREHIRKEDTVLFEFIGRTFSSEEDNSVTAEFDRFEVKPSLMLDLQTLERKYIEKVA